MTPTIGLRMHRPTAAADPWESQPAEEMQIGGVRWGGEGEKVLLFTGTNCSTLLPSCCRNAPDLGLLVQTETFEEGRLISSYVDKPTNKYSITLANIGLSGYLQMLLKDNFVHADLHPGNILVRLVDPNTLWGRIATFLKVGHAEGQHIDRQQGLLLRHSKKLQLLLQNCREWQVCWSSPGQAATIACHLCPTPAECS